MSSWHYLTVGLHVLAAVLWLGGMFFLAVVGAPVLRRVEPPALRAQLFRQLGMQFRWVGWVAIGVLLMTGILNLHFRGLLAADVLLSAPFWKSGYGSALAVKLTSVAVMLGLSAAHDFVLGPAASQAAPDSPHARALRRRSAWVARVNVVVGLVLLAAAVRLARGG